MSKRIIKHNIRKTLYFSSSIILSTSFFATYLIIKNECQRFEHALKNKVQEKNIYDNTIKSLVRKRNQSKRSVEDRAYQEFNMKYPDPEGIIISMDGKK